MVSEQSAADKLLDYVHAKLVGDDRRAFDQLVYALVKAEQQDCARMLDEELAEQYLKEQGPKYG